MNAATGLQSRHCGHVQDNTMYLDEVDSGLQAQLSLRVAFVARLQVVALSLQTKEQRPCDDRSKPPASYHTRMSTWQRWLGQLNQAG